MNMNEYQQAALSTAIYNRKWAILYPALKMSGEVGEINEKIGKMIRDKDIDPADLSQFYISGAPIEADSEWLSSFREDIKKELGDVLWYIAGLAANFGLTLEDVAQTNIDKLRSRKERGVIKGSGDNR